MYTPSEQLATFATTIATECKAIRSLTGTLSGLSTNAKANVVAAVNELKESADALSISLSALSTRVGTAESGISTNKSDIASLKSSLSTLSSAVSGLQKDIADLETVVQTSTEIADAKTTTDKTWSSSKIFSELAAAKTAVKNELLNGAGAAYDTLKELADLIVANASAIETLRALAAGHVKFDAAQNLTDTQKGQARSNIAAASQSDFTALAGRVSTVESKASANEEAVDGLNSSLAAVKTTADAALPQAGGLVTGDLAVAGVLTGTLDGNAATATRLSSAGKITLSGDCSGSVSFDGSDATLAVTVADDSHAHVISNVDGLQTALNAKAPLASPSLTGTPTAPTATAGTNTTQVATTAFVTTAVANKTSVASATKATQDGSGNVITSTYATKASLAAVATSGKYSDLSGTPTTLKNPTALTLQNSGGASIGSYDGSTATTVKLTASTVGLGNVTNESKATMLTSAALTGTPTAPTATAGTNTTQIATTAFVTTAVANKTSVSGNAGTASKLASAVTLSLTGDVSGSVSFDGSSDVSITATVADDSHAHVISNVDGLQTALNAKAPLASPTFTGTPKAPTASAGTNTTQIATTAFVTTAVANKTSVASATKATQDASGNVITTTYATKTELENASTAANSYTDTAIANLIDSAPDTLNTLGELATALSENVEVTDALNEAIGSKANDSVVVKLSGNQTISGTKTFSSTISGSITGNAGTATKLASAGTITLAGDATGSVDFDGSDATLTVTVADDSHNHTIANVDSLQGTLDTKAPIASPTFTGTPKAPTATAGTNTTQVATTAFVTTAVANKTSVASATKATQDGNGNTITSTYATKTELTNGLAGKFNTSGGNISGHVYLTGAKENSSTSNTTQIVFGTADNNHVAISSIQDALVINPDTSSTTNQIVLYLNKASQFPGGITANVTGNLSGTATKATKDGSGNVIVDTYATKASLAAVATSGAYSDLTGTPTALKNPSTLTLQNSAGSSLGAYDGSSAKTIKLTASTVGLGNVTNESKATMFTSPAFTGTPTAPTAASTANNTQITTTAWVRSFVSSALSGISGASVAQVGDIKLFHGTLGGSDGRRPLDGKTGVADETWELCDGTNGTPDLRGKLAYGAGGTVSLGASVGATEETVDAETWAYTLKARTGKTTKNVLTSPPQGVGLYYLKKTS